MALATATHGTETIAQVIERLEKIVQAAAAQHDRVGYFATLYCRVTKAVAQAIDDGEFEDGPRMERFDVIFANLYLQAFDRWQRGEFPGESWQVAFASTRMWSPLVLQHLLLGMNAHINLDLGIAAALAAPGDQLVALERDFIQINTVLARLVESEEASLGKIWPPLRVLTWGTADDVIINFSMAQARDEAWNFALQLSRASETEREHLIAARDQHIACLALSLIRPSLVLRPLLLPIRVAERGSVAQKIRVLSQV